MYQAFPDADGDDLQHGARFIPGEVTLARREDQPVEFVQKCGYPSCWYWEFKDVNQKKPGPRYRTPLDAYRTVIHSEYDGGFSQQSGRNRYKPGQRIYHFERYFMELIRDQHDGKCPNCGNTHITGSTGEALVRA